MAIPSFLCSVLCMAIPHLTWSQGEIRRLTVEMDETTTCNGVLRTRSPGATVMTDLFVLLKGALFDSERRKAGCKWPRCDSAGNFRWRHTLSRQDAVKQYCIMIKVGQRLFELMLRRGIAIEEEEYGHTGLWCRGGRGIMAQIRRERQRQRQRLMDVIQVYATIQW